MSVLKQHGACLSAPLLRIDIMKLQDGRLVVNEVESLEAMTKATNQKHVDGTTGGSLHTTNMRMSMFLDNFWSFMILDLLVC